MHFGLKEHLTTIRRHWGKIALVTMVAVMVTGAVAFLSSKVFVSQARILILNTSPAERASRPSASDAQGSFASPQDQVMTQVEIIKSPALAEDLAVRLGPERVVEEMTWRWDWLRALPGKWKDAAITRLYEFDLTASVLETIGIRKPLVILNPGPPVAAARDKLMRGLRAGAIVKTDMFGVAFAAPSGDFAAEALNGMIDVYVKHMVELRRPLDTATIAEQEAERLERVLGEAEAELQTFLDEFDILSIDRQKNLLLDRWSRMQEELSRAQGNLRETESKLAVIEAEITSLPAQEALTVTTRPNPVVDRLRERLVQLQAELQRYVVGSDAAQRLRAEIDTIAAQIEREAEAVSGQQTVGNSALRQELTNRATLETAEREALEVRILFLNKELAALDAELRRVAGHEMRYRQYARTVDAREEAYRYALLKREETAIQTSIAQASLAQVVPVERGDVPARASAPQRMRLIALGLIAGLLAGVGLAYILEFSRRTVSTAEESELAIGLPVLATTERFGLLGKRLKQTRMELRRFGVWVMRQAATDRGLRLMFAAAHRETAQSTLITELAKSLQKQGVDVLTFKLDLKDRRSTQTTFKAGPAEEDAPRNDLMTLRAPAWDMARELRGLLEQIGTQAAAGAEPSVQDFPKSGVVLIDAPCHARFPEMGSLVELADQVIPVIEADRTRIAEAWDLIEALRLMEVELPGTILTKRRMKRSSWAFSWMASTQRRAREQQA